MATCYNIVFIDKGEYLLRDVQGTGMQEIDQIQQDIAHVGKVIFSVNVKGVVLPHVG